MVKISDGTKELDAEAIHSVIGLLNNDPLFKKGFPIGVESETRQRVQGHVSQSCPPWLLLDELIQWTSTSEMHSLLENPRAYLGALMGAWATRNGLVIDTEIEATQPELELHIA